VRPDFVRIENQDDSPTLPEFIEHIAIEHKVYVNATEPPSLTSVHPGFTARASPAILVDLFRGRFKTTALQFTTVCLPLFRPKRQFTVNPTKLFTLTTIPLKPFSASLFVEGRFLFNLTAPACVNLHYLSFSFANDAKECLKLLITGD
jgi:hypothetical protein